MRANRGRSIPRDALRIPCVALVRDVPNKPLLLIVPASPAVNAACASGTSSPSITMQADVVGHACSPLRAHTSPWTQLADVYRKLPSRWPLTS
jgi:hypothetical protein